MKNIIINNHVIGENFPTYIIAELSANHEQDFDLAVKTIEAMKEAGADAVKLQTYTAESMSLDSEKSAFMTDKDGLWKNQKLIDLYRKAETPYHWHKDLQKIALDLGLDFFSSPFDVPAVDFLETLNVPAYKIASLEIVDIPLLEAVAKTQKPIIISTGIANLSDIELAIKTIEKFGNNQIAILKCVSAYPTPLEEVNLKHISFLQKKFNKIIGLSDHSLGISIPVASVVLGAKIIEKHFILDKKGNGLDKYFSLNPEEFKAMVKNIREVETALGNFDYKLSKGSEYARRKMRSLFAVKNIKKGEELSLENIKSLRPNLGLAPKFQKEIIGKKAKIFIEKGTALDFSLFYN